jgi:hypothetical protein
MKLNVPILLLLLALPALADGGNGIAAAENNVNAQYTVERVEMPQVDREKLSKPLREELDRLVGQKFDQAHVEKLSKRVRDELRASSVQTKVTRGEQDKHVRVHFEPERRKLDKDPDVTKLAYHSKQGFTGGLEAGFDVHGTQVQFGIQSDADELLERFAGLNTRVSRGIGPKVRLRFEFEAFHQQWNRATLETLELQPEVPGIYRERYNFQPTITVLAAPGLVLTGGVSFQQFQIQFPAARTEAANAVIGTLRYHRAWELAEESGQEFDAGYSLRAATRSFDSDFVYTRHVVNAGYMVRHGDHEVHVRALAGTANGRLPLFERFALGNTQTLRGWNKFDLAPVGGKRVAHGTVEYRYHDIQVYYDVGSVWDPKAPAVARHAAGVGVGSSDGSFLGVGFPIRGNRIEPLFILAMRF